MCADDNSELALALVDTCAADRLQATPTFLTSCNQLHETLGVRHGLMLVGGPLAGKSSVLRTLAAAMTSVSVEAKEQAARVRKEELIASEKVRGAIVCVCVCVMLNVLCVRCGVT